MQMIGTLVIWLLLLSMEVRGLCPPETECFGHGTYNRKSQTCECNVSIPRTGRYTGECCESIGCKPNATCKHGYCGSDGLTCERCQTGWSGPNCTNVTSCIPWLSCGHGSCIESRTKCHCEPGWVGDLCDRAVCQVPCKFGSCPNDPTKCECHENFFGSACEKSYCADGWECHNGGYCIDARHCVCPPQYSGAHCDTVLACSVPCEHGSCRNRPDVCECETNWGPPGKCNIYKGPCLNCSLNLGNCRRGPEKCDCKPGYMGPDCSVQMCEGCANGRCYHQLGGHKACACDIGWKNEFLTRGFAPKLGPCTKVEYCMEPCVYGSCPDDPYLCNCTAPYVGTHCDTIQCPVCCPPQTCDCGDPDNVKCRYNWHHDCCLVKSCFRGDTLVHTAHGLVPIENIKEGDLVVTRHEGDGPSVKHLRRVDQVRKRLIPTMDLVVLRMGDEDIWTTPHHLFFEQETGSWITAVNITTSHSLHGLSGKRVNLQHHMKASELLASSDGDSVTTVYDLSVYEYDRYSVGKEGLLVSSCNNLVDLKARDKLMWKELKPAMTKILPPPPPPPPTMTPWDSEFPIVAVVFGILGFLCLVVIALVLVKKYRDRTRQCADAEPLIPKDQTPDKKNYKSEIHVQLRHN